MNAHEVAKFERIACGGIYEMVSTLHGLPPADGLDETDVRTAVACACLRSFRRENRPSRASRSLARLKFTFFRFYGPEKPIFDKTWVLAGHRADRGAMNGATR